MKLEWHLQANVFPPVTIPEAVEGIRQAIQRTADGFGDEIAIGNLTNAEIVEDLRLQDFVDEIEETR